MVTFTEKGEFLKHRSLWCEDVTFLMQQKGANGGGAHNISIKWEARGAP